MKFQLHSFGESGHSYKIALALHFAKANWQQIFIDFFRGEARSETYKNEINAMAEVPVLVHGDKKIYTIRRYIRLSAWENRHLFWGK